MGLVRFCVLLLILSSHFELDVVYTARIYDDENENISIDAIPFRAILQAPVYCTNGTYWDERTQRCREPYILF